MGGEGLEGGDLLEGRILGIFPAVKSNVTNAQTVATATNFLYAQGGSN